MSLSELFEKQSEEPEFEQSGKMLLAMASMGAPGELLAELFNFAAGHKLHKDHYRYLSGPVVQHSSRWKDLTPTWLLEAIAYDRLEIILDEHAKRKVGWEIGPAEITTVLYPATLDAPMRHEYAQIYLWAAAHANARKHNKPVEHFWEKIDGHFIADQEVIMPDGEYYQTYKALCSDIRSKVVNLQADHERISRDKKKAPKRRPSKPGAPNIQLDLF